MIKDDIENLINNLILLYNKQINLEAFNSTLDFNYSNVNVNGNNYFHLLTEYSFQEFCLRNMKLVQNQKITFAQYKEYKTEYTQQIKYFVQTLLEYGCGLYYVNKDNQSPLFLSINKRNYIISLEYLKNVQNIGIYTEDDYYTFLETTIKTGNSLDEDCCNLIKALLSNLNGSIEDNKTKFTTSIISLCKNYSENIYKKYNDILKIESLELMNNKNNENNQNNENNIILNQEVKDIQTIKKNSAEKLNYFINKNFLPIIEQLIKLGADLQNKKESGLIYLMSYPFFVDNMYNFITENKIDVNFEDESGNNALNCLLNNKKNITQISNDAYEHTLKYFFSNIKNDLLIKNNNNEKCIFYSLLDKNNFEEAKIIYLRLKYSPILTFLNSIILNFILENSDSQKIIEFLDIFKDAIDFNLFNPEQKKTFAHYICLYLSDDTHSKIFNQIFSIIVKLKIDFSLKDQYERNCLFYLFLDQNDNKKMYDPFEQLKFIFENCKFDNLNDKDIFGNNLLFYAVQSNASKCIDLLLNNGTILSYEQANNENSIFSVCLLNKNFQLFNYLYDKIKDPVILGHKIYEPYNEDNYIDKMDIESGQKSETLYDFLNKNRFDKSDINMNKNIINNGINNNNFIFGNKINNNNIFGNIASNRIFNTTNNNIIINNKNNSNIFGNKTNNNIFGNKNKIFSNFNNYPNNSNNKKNNIFNDNLNNNLNINNLLNNNNNNINNNNINNGYNNDLDDLSPAELAFISSSENEIMNNNISNLNLVNNDFNFFNFIDEENLKTLNNYTNNIIIKINQNNNGNKINLNLNRNPLINNFNKNNDEYILEKINHQRNVISENIFRYCLSNNYDDICKLIINNNANLIYICNELTYCKRFKDLYDCIERILINNNYEQEKLVNIIDAKGQTIYHFLPLIQNNLEICKSLEKHNISNIYDLDGNTPMYIACKNFNPIFIHTFSHYSFDSNENAPNIVNYDLFFETKCNKTPLEALYEQLDKKERLILKLIIDISLNTKKVYFIPLIKFLIDDFTPINTFLFKLDYKADLNENEYIRKVIGLYLYYTKELKGDIMIKDENGNDCFMMCVQKNNFDFLLNILLEEHNICLNSTNNKGKSVIHLIIEMQENTKQFKKNILTQTIQSGFDFNIKDNEGLLPIDYAFIEREDDLVDVLKQYYINFGLEIPEYNNRKISKKFDYNKDSDIFYNESISVSMKIDKSENLNGLVSSNFKYDPLTSFYQVCMDEDNIPFNANLVKKDFKHFNQNNENKFCIQIIKDLNKDNEFLTITVNNMQLKTFSFKDFNSAKNKFKELFRELTANDWDNVKNNKLNFKTDYTKYYIFDYTYEEEEAIYDYLKITIKNLYIKKNSEYKGDQKIKDLIYYLLVKSYQNKFSIDEKTKNVEQNMKNIIQRYKSTAITKAVSVLAELKKIIFMRNNRNNNGNFIQNKINYLINSYNDLIPYSKQNKDLNYFYNGTNIDNEISRLTNYYYIENVLKIFLGAIYNLNNIHPLDYIIKALGCNIEVLEKPKNFNKLLSTEEDYIYNYINTTNNANVPITAVYKITNSINDKNFNLKNFDNRYIFFHGTKVENVIGILSQGLKIAPVQAINTGKSYGNGIYLSDSFTVSLGYCSALNNGLFINNFRNRNKRFMFMAEVAVGAVGQNADTYVVSMNMNFNNYFATDEGYRIFKNNGRLNYGSGIIVAHEETNVRIKYLIEID